MGGGGVFLLGKTYWHKFPQGRDPAGLFLESYFSPKVPTTPGPVTLVLAPHETRCFYIFTWVSLSWRGPASPAYQVHNGDHTFQVPLFWLVSCSLISSPPSAHPPTRRIPPTDYDGITGPENLPHSP